LVRVSVLLILSGIALLIVGQALAAPPSPPPASAGGSPRTVRVAFVVWASANNTTANGTANTTASPCTPQANDYCYRQFVQIWPYITSLRDQAYFLQIALSIAVAVILILIVAVVKYAHDGVKAAKELRLAPDDPEAIAETGALMEFVAPTEMKTLIRKRTERLMAKKGYALRQRKIAENREE